MKTRPVGSLNTPGRRSSWWPRLKVSDDAFGSFAEASARFMGTAQFLVWMSLFVAGWIIVNTVAPGFFHDDFPFQLLTLILSIQASYAAPLILLAQNRQEARDRVGLTRDRETAAQTRADMDFLAREIASLRMRINSFPTRDFVRAELRALLAELERSDSPAASNRGPEL
ncbi:MAG: DUF1003 domain-containing protein [Propioniciclava sp.]|uniref:DUF1003 domain-containing protein n=1 Tax=Propioniciclava sp. TaxID=2038686 RepID=UPI0039E5C72F